jgi:amino acid transporter
MYGTYFILWAFLADESILAQESKKSDAHRRMLSGAEFAPIIKEVAWPHNPTILVGVIITAISQALQCFTVGSYIIQNIAEDEVVPIIKPLAKITRGEPLRALFFVGFISTFFLLMGSVDVIAPAITICYSTM